MLGNATRRKLNKQNWLDHDSNPSQTLKRLKNKAQIALKDMILLADSLPDDLQSEIFNSRDIKELVIHLTRPIPVLSKPDEVDARRTRLAAVIVEMGVKKCIIQHKTINEKSDILSEPVVADLKRSIKICNEIAFKVEQRQLVDDSKNKIFLFSWDKIDRASQQNNLKAILTDLFCEVWIETARIDRRNDQTIILTPVNDEGSINNTASQISIVIGSSKKGATLTLYDKNGSEQSHRSLIIQNKEGDLNVYIKKNKRHRIDSNFGHNTLPSVFSDI